MSIISILLYFINFLVVGLSCVCTVFVHWSDIWGGQLEFTVPCVFNDDPVGLSGFTVEYLYINGLSNFLEARHDAIVGGEAMSVVSGMEWFY